MQTQEIAVENGVFVGVRIKGGENAHHISIEDNAIVLQGEDSTKKFNFDVILGQNASQDDVFDVFGERLLSAALSGYNTCLFAYGQTGSGKTYTMIGNDNTPGVIPRFCERLFHKVQSRANEAGNEKSYKWKIETEYIEIYGEKIRDLLDPQVGKSHKDMKIREHPRRGPYVEGVSRKSVESTKELFKIMEQGNQERRVSSTKMNEVSSRSHAVLVISVQQYEFIADESEKEHICSSKSSQINLIDLAGSERVKDSGVEGKGLKEAAGINSSLTALGKVIQALSDRNGKPPYRDSKLTFLLKESLGGNSKTCMIATVQNDPRFLNETISTLRYAAKCNKIVNNAIVNEDPNAIRIGELQEIIRTLRHKLLSAQSGDGEQATIVREQLTVNAGIINNLHEVWVKSNGIDDKKGQMEQLKAVLKEMESQGKSNNIRYKEVSKRLQQIQRLSEIEEKDLQLKEKAVKELNQEKEKLFQKEKELRILREQLMRDREEAHQQIELVDQQIAANADTEKYLYQYTETANNNLGQIVEDMNVEISQLKRRKAELEQLASDLRREVNELDSWQSAASGADILSARVEVGRTQSAVVTSPARSGRRAADGELLSARSDSMSTARLRSNSKGGNVRAPSAHAAPSDPRRDFIVSLFRDQQEEMSQIINVTKEKDRDIASLKLSIQKQALYRRDDTEQVLALRNMLTSGKAPGRKAVTINEDKKTVSNTNVEGSDSECDSESVADFTSPRSISVPSRPTVVPPLNLTRAISVSASYNQPTTNFVSPTSSSKHTDTPSKPVSSNQGLSSGHSNLHHTQSAHVLHTKKSSEPGPSRATSGPSGGIDGRTGTSSKRSTSVIARMFSETGEERRMRKLEKEKRKIEERKERIERLRAETAMRTQS